MKRMRIALLSIFTLLFGSVLFGCDFKDPQISFSQNEVPVSVGESLDLGQLLKVKDVDKNKIDFKFVDSSYFDISKNVIRALHSGETDVYATYNNNVFASLKIIVKQKFSTPKNFSIDEDGLISWDKSFGIYASESVPTFASYYKLTGSFVSYGSSAQSDPDVEIISDTNSYQLTNEGIYSLSIVAVGSGKFDDSEAYETGSFGFGYMQKLSSEDLSWDVDGTLSWTEIENAKYKVYVDGIAQSNLLTETEFDLKEVFDAADAGQHSVKVELYDAVGDKMPTLSDEILIKKLQNPVADYSYSQSKGGLLSVTTNADASHYDFVFEGEEDRTITVENNGNFETSFDSLNPGLYTLYVKAYAQEGNFYCSDAVLFGDVYKLAKAQVSGRANLENDVKFNLTASGENPVDTKLFVRCGQNENIVDGIAATDDECNFIISALNAGQYTVTVRQFASAQQNEIFGENVFVLNSDESDEITLEKLGVISAVSHSYQNDVSILEFAKIENATNYALFVLSGQDYVEVDSDLFECQIGTETVKFVFEDKIDNLEIPQNERVFTFKVVAKKDDDNLTISSSKQKVLTELAIATNIAKENTEKTYSWTAVENADSYKLEIFAIDKNTFENGQTDIDVSSLVKVEENVDTNSYAFENEGYYLVRVFSITENENEFINSKTSFDNLVCVSEKLVLQDFDISRFDGRFYASINNEDHFDKYEIYIDNVKVLDINADVGEISRYQLETDFSDTSKTYRIEVVAKSSDSVLYENSQKCLLTVAKLAPVSAGDITAAEQTISVNANLSTSTSTQYISIDACEGANGVYFYQQDDSSTMAGGRNAKTASLDIGQKTNVTFCFKYFGSSQVDRTFEKDGNDYTEKVFQKSEGKIYLDSEESLIDIRKLETPTLLSYYDGALTFKNTNTALTSFYVLTLVCKDENSIVRNIVVKLDTTATASFESETAEIGSGSEFVSNTANDVSIDIEKILDEIATTDNVQIRQVYSQAISYGFAVYSFCDNVSVDELLISSNYATSASNADIRVAKVEKMQEPVLQYQIVGENIRFSWNAISSDIPFYAETTYQMFVNDVAYGSEISGSENAEYSLSEFNLGQYYSFSIAAKNPYYVDSTRSNIQRIFRLNKIESLRMITGGDADGQIEFSLPSGEEDFCDYVLVNNVQNTTGKITITNQASLTLKVVGLKNVQSDGMTTSYLDSEQTSWTISTMQTLKSVTENISYSGGTFSWDEFAEGQNFGNLTYVLIFVDEDDNVVSYQTKQNSVTINETTLRETLQRIEEGDVTIYVYARFDSYNVVAGGTIYYASAITLENDSQVCNYHKYANSNTIKKLTTPVVESVNFVEDSSLANYNAPDIEIEFSGNYDNTASFDIFAEIDEVEVLSSRTTITKGANGKYKYELSADEYRGKFVEGKTVVFKISAISQTDIPSSVGSVNVVVGHSLSSVALVEETEYVGYSHILKVNTNENFVNETSGGFAIKVSYITNGETERTVYVTKNALPVSESKTILIGDIFETYLASGGEIKFAVTSRSYANNESKIYYLACPTYVESQVYNVLESVSAEDITKEAGGFVIDADLNNTTTSYVITRDGDAEEVVISRTNGEYYYEYATTLANGNHTFNVFAMQENYVYSILSSFTANLNRIEAITSVSIERDLADLSDGTISWDAVTNASGYIVRIYETLSGKNYSVETATNSINLSDIFTDEFYDEIGFVYEDKNVVVGITVVGQNENVNNSLEYTFNAILRGIDFDIDEDVSVNEFGIIEVDVVPNTKYLYRFVSSTGEVLTEWKQVLSNTDKLIIDASEVTMNGNQKRVAGTIFDIEIIILGDLQANVVVFDSQTASSKSFDLKFVINSTLNSVDYSLTYPSDVIFNIETDKTNKIYYGVDASAILTGQVGEFVLSKEKDNDNGTSLYKLDVVEFIVGLTDTFDVDVSQNCKVYFWNYQESERENYYYISSPVAEFTFSYTDQTNYIRTQKYTKIEGSDFETDYTNSYALFKDDSGEQETDKKGVGVIVRVKGEDVEFTKLITDQELKLYNYTFFDENDSSENILALNVTKVFEESEELSDLYGEFTIDFVRITSQKIDSSNTKIGISQWVQAQQFTRLESVTRMELSGGTVSWLDNKNINASYYVYLIAKNSYNVDTGDIGSNYIVIHTENDYYVVMDLISDQTEFYLAVQAVSLDGTVLPSAKAFITERVGSEDIEKLLRKNKITSSLKLKDGNISFDWENASDFVTFLQGTSGTLQESDTLMKTIFTGPFSFTVSDIARSELFVRFKFTDLETNKFHTFEVNANELLGNLFELDPALEAKLSALALAAATNEYRAHINSFISLSKNSKKGIGNSKNLFDDFFEGLQSGRYDLKYSLIGTNYSISSNWVSFENNYSDKEVYVCEQPQVKVLREKDENDSSKNTYKILIRKSKIYEYNSVSGEYEDVYAENYIFKLYRKTKEENVEVVFNIYKQSGAYIMTCLSMQDSPNITGYSVDKDGGTLEQGEDEYIMIYLNMNNGDSLLGTFGDEIEKSNFKFQVYAVGNDVSFSSKSEVFEIIFLGFDENMSISNGSFTWTSQMNRKTNIFYKKSSGIYEGETEVEDENGASTFDMNSLGSGLYEYIKFVSFGEINGNKIYVDSEVYVIYNVYKLESPKLSNTFGKIFIDDTDNKKWIDGFVDESGSYNLDNNTYDGCYSSTELYTYKINNNKSNTANIIVTDAKQAVSVYQYEAGTTGYLSNDPDYAYKQTEKNADSFYVTSVGSTSKFNFVATADSNVRKIVCVDEDGLIVNKSVAISSSVATLNAKMIGQVKNVKVKDGLLEWDAVTGRDDLSIASGFTVVYKVTAKQYSESGSDDGITKSFSDKEFVFYTTKTEFDFAEIDEQQLDSEKQYFTATVQALSLKTAVKIPSGISNYQELIGGNYAYGNSQYASSSTYVLLSEGTTVDGIFRSEPIANETIDGQTKSSLSVIVNSENNTVLRWKYEILASEFEENKKDGEYNLLDNYTFAVLNERKTKSLTGTTLVSDPVSSIRTVGGKTVEYKVFEIKFEIDDGMLNAGIQKLYVYATNIKNENAIKSYPREITVEKLKMVEEADCEITTSSENDNIEIYSLKKYFVENPDAIITLKIKGQTLVFTNYEDENGDSYTFKIIRDGVEDLANKTVKIDDDDKVTLWFKVEQEGQNILYSDVNESIVLQRSKWPKDQDDQLLDEITYNDIADIFNWTYSGSYALNRETSAVEMTKNGEEYEEAEDAEELSLPIGTIYTVVSEDNAQSIISVEEEVEDEIETKYYKISNTSIVGPTYIVKIVYVVNNIDVQRTYTTTNKFIQPTIIGKIKSISVRAKLGPTNIQSTAIENAPEEGFAFDLFASGAGTQNNPFIIGSENPIDSENQFLNLQYRMKKDENLRVYNGNTTEEEVYYFRLSNDIEIQEFEGVLFTGEFEGVIDGYNHTIAYSVNGSVRMSQQITIGAASYENAISLFEKLSSKAIIKNVDLSVTYADTKTRTKPKLIAGLAVTNNGQIENVNLTGFVSNIVGANTEYLLELTYCGIVGVNSGITANIKRCNVLTDIEIETHSIDQHIKIAGIAGINYATIEECGCGATTKDNSISVIGEGVSTTIVIVEIAGIVYQNETNAVVKQCKNYAEVSVTAEDGSWRASVSGIAISNDGTIQECTNENYVVTTSQIITVTKGEIILPME